jgi:general stress protein 26
MQSQITYQESEMDKKLIAAIKAIHEPDGWVHFSSIGPDGGPHVTPLMMGIHDKGLLFSFTGKQKKRNLERDPRACVSICKPVIMGHVIVWGKVDIRHDDEAQEMWNEMIIQAFGEERLNKIQRELSLEQTSLGVLKPDRYRIYDID